ncbi:MAG: tRNA 2-thiouridine(34) synthase MnmA [Acidobacteriota bacterium]
MNGWTAVAMSGGVDSSAAAALVLDAGDASFGVTMRLFGRHGVSGAAGAALPLRNRGASGRCCGGEDTEMARRAAAHLGIPFFVLDFEDDFRNRVVKDFVDSYRAGRTPVPCAQCNQSIKFDRLLRRVLGLGAKKMVTGHYARRGRDRATGRITLQRAVDERKDQTYFLFGLTQEMLANVDFPLGSLSKAAVRNLARRRGLPNAEKPESQDICFIPDGNYRRFVERLASHREKGGKIVDDSGRVLGSHDGLSRFTVGQRHGLGLGREKRLYVTRLDTATRRLVVGEKEKTVCWSLTTGPVNWVSRPCPPGRIECQVQVRHRQPPVPAMLQPLAAGGARVVLRRGIAGVAPGQAAVFYEDQVLLGGGWIDATDRSAAPSIGRPGKGGGSDQVDDRE